MSVTVWYLVAGLLLIGMAAADSVLKRLPLTTTLLYLGVGVILGPVAVGAITIDAVRNARFLELVSELVVIVSLFAAGLKMRTPLSDRRWLLPAALAFAAMAVTVGLIALTGVFALGLPIGAAVILGAVLAPTDPVLASDVQVAKPTDEDRLRFSLTGEAGMNDGTAFPFIMLGLGLLGLHELGAGAWRWWAVDVAWAIAGGLAIGAILGTAIAYVVVYLRREQREALGLDDFLALGLIALSYGVALIAHTYGFLAVFAAGLAVRRIERRNAGEDEAPAAVQVVAEEEERHDAATDPDTAPAYMAQAVLGFSEQLERLGTVAVVLLVGAMLVPSTFDARALWFVPLILLVIRPLAVLPILAFAGMSRLQKGLIAWFGIRGIGSIYYLTHAITSGLPEDSARLIASLTLCTVAVSVVVHGASVTPLMRRYRASAYREAAPR